MKIAETKTASFPHLHQSGESFFQKNRESAFFSNSQTDLQTKHFFSQQATIPFIQPKLTIGRPGDKYEQEADAVAQKVVSSSDPTLQAKCTECDKEASLQKQSLPEEEELQMQPMEDEEDLLQTQSMEEEEDLQLKPSLQLKDDATSAGRTEANPWTQSRINSSRGSGLPIDSNTRSFMESRMQTDFSSVNIHTGDEAVQMNRELGARAFTVGSNIYFNSGEYRPETTEGKKLLAHELTHTVQQGQSIAPKIQRQEQPEVPAVRDVLSPVPGSGEGSTRASRCFTDPEFPDFRCLAYALKLDIDENLWNNAPHFYRAAYLHPGDNELMWNTFLRYGLGVNLLQTSFGFLGANETLGSILSYGSGVGLKSYEFITKGKLELDVPIPLGRGINLDLKLDINADPDNLTDIQGIHTGVGITGHF